MRDRGHLFSLRRARCGLLLCLLEGRIQEIITDFMGASLVFLCFLGATVLANRDFGFMWSVPSTIKRHLPGPKKQGKNAKRGRT